MHNFQFRETTSLFIIHYPELITSLIFGIVKSSFISHLALGRGDRFHTIDFYFLK